MKAILPTSPARGQGFTLLEVMIALAVIAIVLVSVLRMQGQTISMNETFRFYTIAPQLAAKKMAELRIASEEGGFAQSGEFADQFRGYTWQAKSREVSLVTDQDREMNLRQVEVKVSYMEGQQVYTTREYMQPASGSL
ncbi:MAG: type II secretion system minor pseudopilin GspI [Desulfosalsimonadaceae bacterium]